MLIDLLFNITNWCIILSSGSYCPGGPDSDFEYSTQSYTGYEVSYHSASAPKQGHHSVGSQAHSVDSLWKNVLISL